MSSEVKRYGVSGPDWEVGEEPDGEFALWSDYAALEAENAALKHRCGMFGLELENAEERRIQAERKAAILRQHKTDYMEAAEVTRKALEAKCTKMQEALRKIMEAHRFNVAAMPTTEVHSICFDALAASTRQEV